jgi:hypothetical protein
MPYYKSEITGSVNVLVLYAQRSNAAIEEGWNEPDVMLTPSHVEQVKRGLAEAKRYIAKAQEGLKKFEGVAEARKLTVV